MPLTLERLHGELGCLCFVAALLFGFVGFMGQRDSDRITILEKKSSPEIVHGYLYVLNRQNKWDRLRADQVERCRLRECAVFYLGIIYLTTRKAELT